MKSTIVVVVFLLVAVYAVAQIGSMYLAKSNLQEFVEQTLFSVDDSAQEEVKRNIVAKAQKLGITMSASDINVVYEDADTRLVSQRIVGKKIPIEFKNKRIIITCRYVATVAGFSVNQQIHASTIKQLVVRATTDKAAQELLDSP